MRLLSSENIEAYIEFIQMIAIAITAVLFDAKTAMNCWICENRIKNFIGDVCNNHEDFEKCVDCAQIKHISKLSMVEGWYFYKCTNGCAEKEIKAMEGKE